MSENPTLASTCIRRRPGRPRRQPSGRNLQLYYELVCESRPRPLVAARFRLSSPRVTQLRNQTDDWIDFVLSAAAYVGATAGLSSSASSILGNPGSRFHLAIALRYAQLIESYGPYIDQFGGSAGAAAFGQLVAASDAGVLPAEFAARLPSRDLIRSAVRMARELDDLTRILRHGPFARHPFFAPPSPSPPATPGKDNSPLALQFLLLSPAAKRRPHRATPTPAAT